jgi:hypothetical protein
MKHQSVNSPYVRTILLAAFSNSEQSEPHNFPSEVGMELYFLNITALCMA